jgi:TonB family protein
MAEMKIEDRIEEEPVKSLASALADASAARLLVFDELPAEEKPRPGDRVLLVGIVWGGSTLVELEQVATGTDLTVERLFDLPAAALPKNFKLVKHVGAGHVISLPDRMSAEVHAGGHHVELAKNGWRIEAPFRGIAYEIATNDRIVVRLAPQLTLIARYVRETRPRGKGLFQRLDLFFASVILLALLGLGVFFRLMSTTVVHPLSYKAELQLDPDRYTRYQVKPAPPVEKVEQPKVKELSGVEEGEKAKGEEGKLGEKEAKKQEAEPSKPGTKVVDPDKKTKDLAKIKNLGLIAALSKMGAGGGGAASAVLGPGGLGSGINNSLGGRAPGKGQGDQYGTGGSGTRGTGHGGGGAAMGIGGLGTKGSGAGRGGYGSADLGGRGKEETIFVPGRTTVEGGLSRDVINRVIQKHYNEIKYCYEKELTKDPGLYGKVTVLFVIDGEGKVSDSLVQQTTMSSEPVETCMVTHVKRWTFPAPQGGGTVQVTYPYVFKNGNQ